MKQACARQPQALREKLAWESDQEKRNRIDKLIKDLATGKTSTKCYKQTIGRLDFITAYSLLLKFNTKGYLGGRRRNAGRRYGRGGINGAESNPDRGAGSDGQADGGVDAWFLKIGRSDYGIGFGTHDTAGKNIIIGTNFSLRE